jgi:dihydroorotase
VAALVAGLNDGTIDCIATDHAPHAVVDKLVEYDQAAFGISGFETAFASLYSLVLTGQCELATIIRALTVAPVAMLGLPRSGADRLAGPAGPCSPGTLAIGALADVAVFDLEASWDVDPAKLLSLGKNTPLDGITLRGRAFATVVGGAVVHGG